MQSKGAGIHLHLMDTCLRRCRRITHPASPGLTRGLWRLGSGPRPFCLASPPTAPAVWGSLRNDAWMPRWRTPSGMTPGGTAAHSHESGGRGRCGASGGAGDVSARASSVSGPRSTLRRSSAISLSTHLSERRRGSGLLGRSASSLSARAFNCAMVCACCSSGVRGARKAGRGRPLRRTWRLRGMGNILSCGCIRTGQNRPGDGSDSPSRKGPARRAPWHLAKILGRLRSEVLPPAAPMTGFRTGCRICLSPARGRKRAVAGVCRLPFFPSLRLKAQASSRNLIHWIKFISARSHLAFHEPTQGLNLSRRARVRCSRSCLICHPSAPASRIQARPLETLKTKYGAGGLASDKLSFIRRYKRSLRPRRRGAGIHRWFLDTCLRRCRRATQSASPAKAGAYGGWGQDRVPFCLASPPTASAVWGAARRNAWMPRWRTPSGMTPGGESDDTRGGGYPWRLRKRPGPLRRYGRSMGAGD